MQTGQKTGILYVSLQDAIATYGNDRKRKDRSRNAV